MPANPQHSRPLPPTGRRLVKPNPRPGRIPGITKRGVASVPPAVAARRVLRRSVPRRSSPPVPSLRRRAAPPTRAHSQSPGPRAQHQRAMTAARRRGPTARGRSVRPADRSSYARRASAIQVVSIPARLPDQGMPPMSACSSCQSKQLVCLDGRGPDRVVMSLKWFTVATEEKSPFNDVLASQQGAHRAAAGYAAEPLRDVGLGGSSGRCCWCRLSSPTAASA